MRLRGTATSLHHTNLLNNTTRQAQSGTYVMVDAKNWPEGFCRRDIGWCAL
jgi:phosphoribosylamine-glycine ligase